MGARDRAQRALVSRDVLLSLLTAVFPPEAFSALIALIRSAPTHEIMSAAGRLGLYDFHPLKALVVQTMLQPPPSGRELPAPLWSDVALTRIASGLVDTDPSVAGLAFLFAGFGDIGLAQRPAVVAALKDAYVSKSDGDYGVRDTLQVLANRYQVAAGAAAYRALTSGADDDDEDKPKLPGGKTAVSVPRLDLPWFVYGGAGSKAFNAPTLASPRPVASDDDEDNPDKPLDPSLRAYRRLAAPAADAKEPGRRPPRRMGPLFEPDLMEAKR